MNQDLRPEDFNGHMPATPEPQPEQVTADNGDVCVCQCCLEEDPIYLLGYERGRSDLLMALAEKAKDQLDDVLVKLSEEAA